MIVQLPNTGEIIPRDYQAECYEAMVSEIRSYTDPFFIEASVGAGKTIVMAMLAARCSELGWPALFLARDGVLVDQNSATFWDCKAQNSIYCASLGRKSTYYPIVVGSEGSVCRSIDTIVAEIGVPRILCIDECHTVNYEDDATQYMQIIAAVRRANPGVIIIGLTGSPYRGCTPILGKFWKKCVFRITTEELVKRGMLVPTIFGFGHDDVGYQGLSSFKISDVDGVDDFSASELAAMEEEIIANGERTGAIIAEVLRLTENRNAVMITASGRRHIDLIASFLPDDSYVIITDKVKPTERLALLNEVKERRKKFIIQIGCLTTGFDESLVDTSVIMRKIRSLTLLIQLLGRGMRLLKDFQKAAGVVKHDHLVLDYTDTMAEMHDLYSNPILDAAIEEKSKRDQSAPITCPACQSENSPFARRCTHVQTENGVLIGGIPNFSIDGRCEWFWSSVECQQCKTQNDKCATECRKCGHLLKDLERNLVGKHYTDDDWHEVKHMRLRVTKNQEGLVVDYTIRVNDLAGDRDDVVSEIFWPKSDKVWMKAEFQNKFMKLHCPAEVIRAVRGKPAVEVLKHRSKIMRPSHITHRINDKGKSIIHRKRDFVIDGK